MIARGYCRVSGTFGRFPYSSSSFPSNALISAFLKTLSTVVMMAGWGSSKLPDRNARAKPIFWLIADNASVERVRGRPRLSFAGISTARNYGVGETVADAAEGEGDIVGETAGEAGIGKAKVAEGDAVGEAEDVGVREGVGDGLGVGGGGMMLLQ